MILKLGSFKVTDKIIVADPCYSYDHLGTLILDNVLSGKYIASAEVVNNRVSALAISHFNFKNDILESESVGYIAVDSEQAGFFDFTFSARMKAAKLGIWTVFMAWLALSLFHQSKQE